MVILGIIIYATSSGIQPVGHDSICIVWAAELSCNLLLIIIIINCKIWTLWIYSNNNNTKLTQNMPFFTHLN